MSKVYIDAYKGQVPSGSYDVFMYEYLGSTLQKWPVVRLCNGKFGTSVMLEVTPWTLLRIAASLLVERLNRRTRRLTRL